MAIGIFTLRQQLRGLLSKNWTGAKTPYVEYLVVGGGGGGKTYGGGGGAGGVLTGITPVTTGTTYTVTVGGGGTGSATASIPGGTGVDSIISTVGIIAKGGGGAATPLGGTGGSGGGGGDLSGNQGNGPGGQGIFGQGNAGGSCLEVTHTTAGYFGGGGGGGAGTVGLNGTLLRAGNGGAGISSAISGTVTPYGGGGGGCGYAAGGPVVAGAGGVGGGGAGSDTTAATAGQANTGGGGGGGAPGASGGAGGSGIVIVSYPDIYAPLTTGGATSPTVSTSGSGSIYFNGSNYVAYPAATQFDLSGSSFTIQFWMYMTASTGYRTIICKRPNGAGPSWSLKMVTGTNTISFGNSAAETAFTGTISYNVWTHIAVVCDGTNTKMFINGTYDSNVALAASANNAASVTIGANGNNSSEYMTGYISNLQVIKGVQLYPGTTNFTPSTKPTQNTSGTSTSLLLNTATPYPFADNSSYANSYTATGSPSWNALTPFTTGQGLQNRVYTWINTGAAGSSATGTFTV